MARKNLIIAGPARKNDPQVKELPLAAAFLPGATVQANTAGDKLEAAAAGAQLMVLQEAYMTGGTTADQIAIDELGVAVFAEDDVDYNALVAASTVCVADKTPLKYGTAGVLELGVIGTDEIVAFARETYTVDSGGAELVKIRKNKA